MNIGKYLFLGISLVSCCLGAMDKNELTSGQKLRLGRMAERMESDNSRSLRLWQDNNMRELEIERQWDMKILESQFNSMFFQMKRHHAAR
jgi:hypothetical protein